MRDMSKRKITQQQQRRISNKQAELLNTTELTGLVIAHYGQSLEIEDSSGDTYVCKKRQHLGPIVPGDRVRWQQEDNAKTGIVTAIEPRDSLLSRPDARGVLHAVASNIDQMFIVIAPTPAPNQTTIDRYLLAACNQNIQAILVLNKDDLLEQSINREQILDIIQIYKAINVPTIMVSAAQNHLSELNTHLSHKTSVFVGQSGVGKSSIIATLLPAANVKTGAISDLSQLGTHTTTTARLYHLAALDGNIIDSPGMREFPLWQQEPSELAAGFIEFKPFLHACKFRNCKHISEPGCAILEAVANNKISRTRLLSYQKILSEMQKN